MDSADCFYPFGLSSVNCVCDNRRQRILKVEKNGTKREVCRGNFVSLQRKSKTDRANNISIYFINFYKTIKIMKKISIKREQSQAGLSFAEREKFRPQVKNKLLLLLALLLTAATVTA